MSNQKTIGIIIAVIVVVIAGFLPMGNNHDSETVHIGYLPSDHDSALFVEINRNVQ